MVKKKRQSEPGDDCGESTESCDETAAPSCQHVKKSVDQAKLKKILRANGFSTECSECSKTGATVDKDADFSLWMCLRCGSHLCSRKANQHALGHFKTPHSDSHALAVNTTSWTVCCYACDREISYSSTKKLQEVIEFIKKQPTGGYKDTEERAPEAAIPMPSPLSILDSPCVSWSPSPPSSQRVRGLNNLGNTCFFNSVLQCLVQTPYLPGVLQEMSQGGENFHLQGTTLRIPGKEEGEEEKEVEVPPISGVLPKWGSFTETLATTLETLQAPGRCDVFNPSKLFNSLVNKFPQFRGGEQHDSHELLRHLLEAVRSEDLRRYQGVVLEKLDLTSREKRSDLDTEKKNIIKYYGQKVNDMMLRPEQVFRGFLVSTLECQECQHSSNRTEYFLDLSLPVTAEKPQPPVVTRRKGPAPEEQINCLGAPDESKPSKHQLKKEKQAARKSRKNKKAGGNNSISGDKQTDSTQGGDGSGENKSGSEQSDADIEDNLEENPKTQDGAELPQPRPDTAANFALYHMESGYNSEKLISSDSIRASPVDLDTKEKSDVSPERIETEKEEKFCLSATAIPLEYKPLSVVDSPMGSNPDSGVASPETAKRTLSDTINAESPVTSKELGSPSSLSSEINVDMSSPRQSNNSPVNELQRPLSRISFANGENSSASTGLNKFHGTNKYQKKNSLASGDISNAIDILNADVEQFKLDGELNRITNRIPNRMNKSSPALTLNVNENSTIFDLSAPRTNSPDSESSKWRKELSPFINRSTTVSPRYQCDDGEYSIQSCLNQFTTSELLAGNNKVGCEACTKRANSEKTIYTNATKRFLISSPPAVLILHLKRFQIGPRCMFRKIMKHVNFPVILDLAPFCSQKVKTLPNVSSDQTKLLYSLYGVVEHSGSMHGGHYVAYVKVRPNVGSGDKRWSFLPTGGHVSEEEEPAKTEETPTGQETSMVNGVNGNDDTDSSMSGYESGDKASGGSDVESPAGKWYYISDSRVQETTEDRVLKVQAYLLFYERIM